MPYQDTSTTFRANSVFDHVDNEFEKPETRTDYKFVACGIDFGEHYHHVVTLGMRPNGRIDLMDLYRVPRSVGAEHIEEDLKLLIRHMDMYQPDIILPDKGFSGNYVDKLIAYYGPERVYGVQVRTALSNGDYNAHFNDGDSTVVLDKLTQNEIMMGNMRRGDIHFWKNSQRDPRVITFIKHWQNVIIRTEDREDNQTHLLKHVKVITRKGGDQ